MRQTMDEHIKYFYEDEGFGPAIHAKPASPEKIAKFKGKLPDQLLKYWELYGFSGYGKGLFCLVDPDEYEPALEAWIGDTDFMETDEHYVIARSAFGKLFLWGKKTGQNLTIEPLWAMIFPSDSAEEVKKTGADKLVAYFMCGQNKEMLDFEDYLEKPLFNRALKTLGPLEPDEMYAFEPALALGGKADLKFLTKVKAVEHLVFLADLGEKRIMRDIVQDLKDAKDKGLI
jgi:hypothetical protein